MAVATGAAPVHQARLPLSTARKPGCVAGRRNLDGPRAGRCDNGRAARLRVDAEADCAADDEDVLRRERVGGGEDLEAEACGGAGHEGAET